MTRIRAALAVAVVGAVLLPVPARAAPLGTVTVGQQSGTVTDTPMFATATTSAACPRGFGANALIRVGRPDGPFTNLARPSAAGGYDTAPVVFRPDRSFETALGQRPGDGAWSVVVECFSPDAGRAAERFVTTVTVTGTAWRVGAPPEAGPGTSASARPGTETGGPPTDAATATAAQPGDAGAAPERTNTAGERAAGPGGMPVEFLVGGAVALIALAVGAVLMARRRRTAAAAEPARNGQPPGRGRQPSMGRG